MPAPPADPPAAACVPEAGPGRAPAGKWQRRTLLCAAALSLGLHAAAGVLASRGPLTGPPRGAAGEPVPVEIIDEVPVAASEAPPAATLPEPPEPAHAALSPPPPKLPPPLLRTAAARPKAAAAHPPAHPPALPPKPSRPDRPQAPSVEALAPPAASVTSSSATADAVDGAEPIGAGGPPATAEAVVNGAAPASTGATARSGGDNGGDGSADHTRLLNAYGRAVWRRIAANKPQGLHLAGSTGVAFTLSAEGALLAASVARSSGNVELDRLALQTLHAAAPFPPPPSPLRSKPLSFVLAFEFR